MDNPQSAAQPGAGGIRWEKWTSVSTIILALCALATSFWQGYTLQQHNKLSVRPYLQFEANFQRFDEDKIDFELLVNNNGLGPADVVEAVFYVDGKAYQHAHQIWSALGVKLSPNCLGSGNVGRFYKVGDQQMVIRTAAAACRLSAVDYQKLQQSLQVRLVYNSIYGESFTAGWGF